MIKKGLVVIFGLMMMGMIGCSNEPETDADKAKESLHAAAESTKDAAHDAAEATKDMAHDAAKATEDAAHDAKEAMK